MNVKKIFIAQKVLDSMFEQGKAHLEQDQLMIHAKENQIYRLTPAVKFLYVADGSPDPHDFVGKIFTKKELEKISVDIYMDSAIYKDIPYQVDPGYVGVPEGIGQPAVPDKTLEEKPVPEKTAQDDKVPQGEKLEEASDQELLSDYFLKIL